MAFATRRLTKELMIARQKLPPGISIAKADNLQRWEMDIRVLDDNPIYAGHIFRLLFIFGTNYPIEPPEVTFLQVSPQNYQTPSAQSLPNSQSQPIDLTQDVDASDSNSASDNGARPIPLHPHVYSNGIICLDLLGSADWSPVQSVESVCVSVQSMLTGNTKAVRPEGDDQFCASMGVRGPDGRFGGRRGPWGRQGRSLKNVKFMYDDDTV